jgi:hypothetical protein
MDNTNTINQNQTINQLFNVFSSVDGISLTEKVELIKSKTPKEKILYSIRKEIREIENRTDLRLKVFKKGDTYIDKSGDEKTYKNNRIENRFHKNPIGDLVSFNLKYKGQIIPISNQKSFSCKNNIESLIEIYKKYYSIIENLTDDHQLFYLEMFQTEKQKKETLSTNE